GWAVCQRVLISTGQSCGHCGECGRGLDMLCSEFRVHGHQTQGGFAEFSLTRAVDLIPISPAWSFAEWAAAPLTFVTAWNMLHRQGRVQANDTVVVFGASSG